MTEVNVTHVNTEEDSRHNAVGKLVELTEQKVEEIHLLFFYHYEILPVQYTCRSLFCFFICKN